MKNLLTKKPYAYQTFIKYFCSFIVLLLTCYSLPYKAPVSIAVYSALCMTELSPLITGILCAISALIYGGGELFTTTGIAVGILFLLFSVYRLRGSLPSYELLIYIPSALAHYLIFYDSEINLKIITTVAITVISFIINADLNYFFAKGLRYKPTTAEFITLSIFALILSLGLINALSAEIVWAFAVFTILCIGKIFTGEVPFITAMLIGLPFAVYYTDITYIACAVIIALPCIFCADNYYRLSGVIALLLDYLLRCATGLFSGYSVYDFLLVLSVVLVFCVIPKNFYFRAREVFNLSRENFISKRTINKANAKLKDKLLDLSEVFIEISSAFDELKQREISEPDMRKLIVERTYANTCADCQNLARCKSINKNLSKNIKSDLDKTVKIGMAKGKVSFIDLPNGITSVCFNTNALLFSINKDLAEYRNALLDNSNFSLSREIVAKQSEGIAEMLKTLAISTGKELSFNSEVENKLLSKLRVKGITAFETLIYGNGDNTEISLILGIENFDPIKVEKTVSSVIGIDLKITEFSEFTQGKIHLYLSRPSLYKAVYGVASATKTESEQSGDTHSETLLQKSRFTFALSDGMGSGNRAKTVSSVTLSLIESLYKAGLKSDTVLPLVNKILSINTDDTFSALDICSVDLNTLNADFIKFGAPRGFIISKTGIKIVDGSTLPIGIVNEVEPCVVTANLSEDDIVILMTDGVSDAYGSTAEIIDKLKVLPSFNPTAVAESLIAGAMDLSNGALKDDMTVLAVRIVKNYQMDNFNEATVA